MEVVCHSVGETLEVAAALGQKLEEGSVLCFFGGLGAGKTTFIKGLTKGATGLLPDNVSSPTFVYLNIYEGEKVVYHFDLYRLTDSDEFLSMGFDEYFTMGGICCLEWSEKISPLIPDEAIIVKMEVVGQEARKVTIQRKDGGDAF